MKRAFTLAEVLITLAIIGVVAAISIPSVISNTQQQEFKTGLRKAVSVLNSAITMNMALDGETPYENNDLFNYLKRHMSVVETTTNIGLKYSVASTSGSDGQNWAHRNYAFYTVDGMRFEVPWGGTLTKHRLYESPQYFLQSEAKPPEGQYDYNRGRTCGALGLNSNYDKTTMTPCLIMVDVNGDRKPNPANINCKNFKCSKPYKFSDPLGLKLTDLFTIMITDKEAIPYGVAAQRAMYQAQAKK